MNNYSGQYKGDNGAQFFVHSAEHNTVIKPVYTCPVVVFLNHKMLQWVSWNQLTHWHNS